MQTEDGGDSINTVSQDAGNESHNQQPAAEAGWKFEASDEPVDTNSPAADPIPGDSVSWTASEYVAHHKSLLWFACLGLAVAGLALITYFITRELITAVVTVIIGLSFGVFGARPPQVLQYILNEKGLRIGDKLYPYERIKSFSTLQEGPIHSILLVPLQRFLPTLTVYYDEADEDRILNVISSYIPHEDHRHDVVDRLMSKIRF